MKKITIAPLKIIALTIIFLSSLMMQFANSQTTLVTLPNPPYNGSNGAGVNFAVTFVLENTNAFPVLLTSASTWVLNTEANGTFQLWYSATSLGGTPLPITSPTWTMIQQVTSVPAPAVSGIYNVFPSLSFVIPALTQYRFAVFYVTTSSHYSGTGVGTVTPSTFSGGGVTMKLGDVIIGGGTNYVGWGGSNNPRWWTGSVTFMPAVPCTSPPVAGTSTATPSSGLCVGQNITLDLSGYTGGTGQDYQWQSSTAIGGPYTNIGTLQSGAQLSTPATGTLYYRCIVTCSSVSDISTPVLVSVNSPFSGGTYTINSAVATGGTNFQTFNAFKNAVACGIAGPIIVNVVAGSGPYNEQVSFPVIGGMSAVNTITINGNNCTLTFGATLSTAPSTLELNGTDYMFINNLNISGTGATYALAGHLWNNADNNAFNGCTFTVPANTTSTTCVPFSISGSQTSPTTTGSSGSNNVITGCTMNSGYYNTVLYGNSASPSTGNQVINCNIRDQYLYGLYSVYQNGAIYRGNTIERPTRTTLSTFYGMYLTTSSTNLTVDGNRIRNSYGAAPTNTGTTYGIYNVVASTAGNENKIINNMVSDISSSGPIYGIYVNNYNKVYHNTIALDQTASTGTTTTYAIYCTSGLNSDIRNNIVTVRRGGTGVKYCLYYPSVPATSNYNDLYMNSAAGTNYVAYNGTNYATLAAWTAATGKDANSVSADPLYIAPGSGDYTPSNGLVNNIGTPVGVLTDINGSARSVSTPDPGAYEFSVGGLDAGIAWVSPVSPATAGLKTITVNINNTQTTTITDLNLSYNDGTGPVTQSFTGLNILGGTNQNFSFTTQYNLVSSVTMTVNILSVNGGSDAVSGNNTAIYSLCVGLNGTYTINSAVATGGTNYQTFTAAVAALSCGVAGPVVFNVNAASGPYNEQIEIPSIGGTSAVNTITINGNNRTLTQTLTGTPANYATLNLNGADYMTFNNLNIEALGATYGFGVHIMNGSNNNTFSNCTISANNSATGTTSGAVSISGSSSSYTTTGVNGSNNLFTGCTMNGGYFGCMFYGDAVSYLNNANNSIVNCTIQNFYVYGVYNYYMGNSTISGNIIQRPTRATVSTGYGVLLSTGCVNMLIEKNRIRKMWDAAPTSTGTTYCLYNTSTSAAAGTENKYYNNLVSDINFNGTIYGLYLSGANYVKAYHNTLSFDQAGATGTTTTYGIYSTGTLARDFRNNVITMTRGGTGTKYCLYYTNPGAVTSNNNDVYLNAPAGVNYLGYNGTTTYNTLALWQATGFDLQSVSVNPLYFNPAGNNYKPTETLLDNIGTPLGVTNDITGALRSPSAPDAGAYEFTVAAKDVGVFAFAGPAPTGCYTNAETIIVTIRNYGTQVIDFSVDPVTATCDITGTTIATVSTTLNSGTLPVGGTMNVSLSPTVDGTTNGTYTFNAYTTMASDGEPANDAYPSFSITVGPVAGTVSSNITSACVSGSPVLTNTGVYGGAIQWQESTAGSSGPWTNVGSGLTTYTPGTVTQTTWYQALTVCNANSATSNVVIVTVNTPSVTSTTPGSHCGLGTVTLGATGSAGTTVSWYATASGGTALGTGNSFTTPVLNSTTNYYAEAGTGAGLLTGLGNTSVPTASGFNAKRGIQFDAYQSFTLESAQYYAAYLGTTNLTVELQNSAGTVLQTATLNIIHPDGLAGWHTIPINFIITPGTGYKLLCQFNSGSLSNYSHSTGANYALPAFNNLGPVGLITNGLDFGPVVTTTAYYYFYNITVSAGCASSRTAVAATITPPPLINVVTADPGLCPGGSTNVSVNSLNDPSYTYAWTSNPAGFTASGAGPHTVSPTATTWYITTATDNTAGPNAGCVAKDSVQVFTGATLTAGTASASQDSYCNSGAPTLILTGSDGGAIQWQSSTISASGPWTNVGSLGAIYNSPTLTQTTYFQALVFCTSNSVTSNVITITVSTPAITSSLGTTRCGYGPVTLQATGSSGTTLNWYDVATGGSPLGTGTSFTTNVTSSTNYYVGAVTGSGGTANATMPAQSTTYSGWVRGYWFTAPSAFSITSIDVPLAGTGQSIAVVRFTGNVPPPTYSTTTNAFTTLFLTQNNSTAGPISCNISVSAGDIIGVLGQVGSGTTALTSYGPTVNPSFITLAGQSVALTRMGMQDYLTTVAPHDIWQEVSAASSIGRIEFTYSTGCESVRTAVPVTVNPSPAITASATYFTPCAGNPTDISVSSSNDPNYTYSWTSIPAGFSQTGPGPFTVNPGVNTTYNVTAIDNTSGTYAGCGAITSVDIIPATNTLSGSATASPPNFCPGGSSNLLANIIQGSSATNYAFTASSGTFTPLVGGTSVSAIQADDAASGILPIGFAFNFEGTPYTQLYASSNGILTLGAANASLTNNLTSGTGGPIIAPLWDDMDGISGTASYLTTGSAGNKVFTFQWLNWEWYYNITTGVSISIQCKLYEADGRIEFIYRQEAGPLGGVSESASIGLGGYISGQFLSLNNSGPSPTASSSTETTTISSKPATGQVYTFTPPLTGSFTYDWSANSAFLSATNISNPVAQNVTSTQTYTVVVTNTASGCTMSSNVTVTVNPPPDPLAGTNAPVCTGLTLALFGYNLASGQTSGNTWSWSGPSFTSSSQNPTVSGATSSNAGTYTLTVTNSNGCTASTSQIIAVNPNPVLSVASQTNASCPGLMDACIDIDANNGTPLYVFDLDGNATLDGNYCGLGAGTYTANVIDDNGCEAAPLIVTITDQDITPPVITTAAIDRVVECDGAGNTADWYDWLITNWGDADASDNCTSQPQLDYYWVNTYNPNNWVTDCGNSKHINVGFAVYDMAGNYSDTTYATFYIVDTIAPAITFTPPAINAVVDPGLCSTVPSLGMMTATDDCAGPALLITNDAPAGGVFGVGVTTVTWTATDQCGNSSTSTTTVTVIDNQNPSITCPPDVIVNANTGVCYATLTLGTPTTGDNCGVSGVTNNAPAQFPVGATIVDWEVTDLNGNKTGCQQFVIVVDNQNPVISGMPSNITFTADPTNCNPSITWLSPTAADNCSVASFTSTSNPGDNFPEGTTTVTYSAIDINGNQTQASFTVTILTQPLAVGITSPVFQCGYNITCNGNNNGQAAATIGGGCLPYSLQWSNGSTTYGNGSLTAGTYTLTVTDGNGHVTIQSITLTQPPALVTTLGPDQSFEFECTCASLVSSTTGGSTCSPYVYSWSTGATSSSITVCPTQSATYSVTVTDINGCVTTDVIQVIKPAVVAQLDRYVLMGTGTGNVTVGNSCSFSNGSIGKRLAAGTLSIGNNTFCNISVAGNNVVVGNNVIISTLYRNTATIGSGAVISATVTPVAMPLTAKVPCFPVFSGGANVNVPNNTTMTISPGTYNNVTLGNNSILKLNAGVYNVNSISTFNGSFILPNGAATAKDIIVFVKTSMNVSNNNVIHGSYYAQGAMDLANGNNTTGSFYGAYFGNPVSVGNNLSFFLDAYCYSNLALCNVKIDGDETSIEAEAGTFNLFPNPNSGTFTIQYAGETGNDVKLTVLNTLGQVVYERKVYEFSGEIIQDMDLSNLNPGIYFMQIINGNEQSNKQFVITK